MSKNTSNKTDNHPSTAAVRGEAVEEATAPATRRLSWGPLAAILVTLFSFLISQVIGAIIVGFWPKLAGWPHDQAVDWSNSVAGQFIFVVIAEVLTILILWWFLRRRRTGFRDAGYGRRPNWLDLVFAASGFGTYFILLIIATLTASLLLHVDVNQKQDLGFNNVYGLTSQLMAFVSLVVLPPIVEETLFRGFLYSGLRRRFKMWPAILMTSGLFALPHLFESTKLLWIAGIDTFILSVVLCFVREKSDGLYAGILIHMAKNSLAFAALYVFAH